MLWKSRKHSWPGEYWLDSGEWQPGDGDLLWNLEKIQVNLPAQLSFFFSFLLSGIRFSSNENRKSELKSVFSIQLKVGFLLGSM